MLSVPVLSALTSEQIIDLWQRGREASYGERIGLLLSAAFPKAQSEDLLRLTIGQRDAVLLRLRELTFGGTVSCVAECPDCRALSEHLVEVSELLGGATGELGTHETLFDRDGYRIRFRPLSGEDLASIRRRSGPDAVRALLLDCCIVSVWDNGVEVSPDELPAEIVAEFGEVVADSDRHSEIWLDTECSECGLEFDSVFDALDFCWREIAAEARRTVAELDYLVAAYGWSQAKILKMSRARRRLYMEASQ